MPGSSQPLAARPPPNHTHTAPTPPVPKKTAKPRPPPSALKKPLSPSDGIDPSGRAMEDGILRATGLASVDDTGLQHASRVGGFRGFFGTGAPGRRRMGGWNGSNSCKEPLSREASEYPNKQSIQQKCMGVKVRRSRYHKPVSLLSLLSVIAVRRCRDCGLF